MEFTQLHHRGISDNGADALSNFMSQHSRPASHNGVDSRPSPQGRAQCTNAQRTQSKSEPLP
eukprot:6488522-Amphidinium_carterae.1